MMNTLSMKKLIVFCVVAEAIVALSACVASSPLTMSETIKVTTDSDQPLLDPSSAMLQRYRQAEQRLPANLLGGINNLYLTPNWLDDGGFWYALRETVHVNTAEAIKAEKRTAQMRYFRYHPKTGVKPLFNEQQLLQALNMVDHDSASANTSEMRLEALTDLQVQDLKDETLRLRINDNDWRCELGSTYQCFHGSESPNAQQANHSNGFISPDGRWQIVVKDHNLVLVDKRSGQEKALTQDGTSEYAYATNSPNPKVFFNQPKGSVEPRKTGYWSPDSRYFVTFQLDLRNTGKLHLQQAVNEDGLRPRLYPYHYPMAGDDQLIQGELIVVTMDASQTGSSPVGMVQRIDTPALLQTYYGDPLWGEFASNNKYYFVERKRGFHTFHLKELSPDTGKVRTLITETNQKFIDPWVQDFRVVPELDMVFWTSERSGMQQLYLYQLNSNIALAVGAKTLPPATVVRALTPNHLFMRALKGVDIQNRQVYFEGSGVTANEKVDDPYYRYLYRVDFNGNNLQQLTPEPVMHNTQVAPDFATFTDTYSTVSTAPEHVVRSTENGRILASLHKVDNSKLLAEYGYVAPQPFQVLAEDGKTPLHGILYFPSDFDPSQSYPVIDDIYTGPHGYFTPKTYDGPLYAHAHALAELGFIVFKMDGRGTGKRDRAFHERSYHNLAGGADDHVWALRKLAETRSYLDLNRVGIYGFSAGGYDTVRAMYRYPNFFKVGVAASGNHDFRVDKAGWNETWMGYPVGEHWDAQSNLTDADKLQGKLFLAHGELDENVHPAATLQLVDRLIKANKDFDFLLYPNMGHVLHYHPHFVRTRWDYFVQHLLGETPPKAYQISSMSGPDK